MTDMMQDGRLIPSSGIAFSTPEGDDYSVHWDPFKRTVVVVLIGAGDKQNYGLGLSVLPGSANSICLTPTPRERP